MKLALIASKYWKEILIGLVIIFFALYWYQKGKSGNSNKPPAYGDLPNSGSGIPQGWEPGQAAMKLNVAMDGMGTDTDTIWNTLEPLTLDQRVAVYNTYTELYWDKDLGDLFEWFADDLDATDLSRALGYFQGTGLL